MVYSKKNLSYLEEIDTKVTAGKNMTMTCTFKEPTVNTSYLKE
jgi:hypothetical protein